MKQQAENIDYPLESKSKIEKSFWNRKNSEQECIPVGCVPSAAVAVSGLVCLWGCTPLPDPGADTPLCEQNHRQV